MQKLTAVACGGLAAIVCVQPLAAQAEKQSVQAFGDDPNWTVIIDPSSVIYTKGSGDFPVFYRLTAATTAKNGGGTVYRTVRPDGVAVELTVTSAPCSDRDGETEPMTAVLRDGKQTFRGCARLIDSFPRNDMVLNGLAMNTRIVSHGGPDGFNLDLAGGGYGQTMLVIDGKSMELSQPMNSTLSGTGWPVISGSVARFKLVDETDTRIATAEIRAETCNLGRKTYPMRLTVIMGDKRYESCASHAFMQPPPLIAIPSVAQ